MALKNPVEILTTITICIGPLIILLGKSLFDDKQKECRLCCNEYYHNEKDHTKDN